MIRPQLAGADAITSWRLDTVGTDPVGTPGRRDHILIGFDDLDAPGLRPVSGRPGNNELVIPDQPHEDTGHRRSEAGLLTGLDTHRHYLVRTVRPECPDTNVVFVDRSHRKAHPPPEAIVATFVPSSHTEAGFRFHQARIPGLAARNQPAFQYKWTIAPVGSSSIRGSPPTPPTPSE